MRVEEPEAYDEAAQALARAAANGEAVRFRGGGTKFAWGNAVPDPDVVISTSGLDRILEHNAADLTAVVQAGAPLAKVQAAFASVGQTLPLDPPLGPAGAATMGGVLATGDSGPLRHRYGAPRDLLLGATVALSDGSIARAGGKVIKNVAGYDLAKLFTGSFGTLGMILEVAVRLHPLPAHTATVDGRTTDPETLRRAALAVVREPLELSSLDVWWHQGAGGVLARASGVAPRVTADAAADRLRRAGCAVGLVDGSAEEETWQRQRDAQRSTGGVVVRVSGLTTGLARVVGAVDRLGATLVGRVSGAVWCSIPAGDAADAVAAVEELREAVAPWPAVVLDAPPEVRHKVEVWGMADGPELQVMRRLKQRFDPSNACSCGIFVGGI
jgi:glycolate oxidase FAD binding subunit